MSVLAPPTPRVSVDRQAVIAERRTHAMLVNEMKMIIKFPEYVRNHTDFCLIRKIGSGGFGTVWLASEIKTGRLVAVKELSEEKLVGQSGVSFVREITTLAQSRSRFVCQLIGFTAEPPFQIIMEYVSNRTLYSLLKTARSEPKKWSVSGTQLTLICLCLAHAISKVHQAGIMHRDLKSSNILLDENYLPILADFGAARMVCEKTMRMTMRVGTISHMAPEVAWSTSYTQKVDVYGFSIVMFQMSELRHPYPVGSGEEEVWERLKRGERPSFTNRTTSTMKKLITMCWDQDPKERPTMNEVFKMFASGKAYFKGTKIKEVKAMARQIQRQDEDLIRHPLPALVPTIDHKVVLRRLKERLDRRTGPMRKTDHSEGHVSDMESEEVQTSVDVWDDGVDNNSFPSLRNGAGILACPDSPEFAPYIMFLCARIELEDFELFSECVSEYSILGDKCTPVLIAGLRLLAKRSRLFIDMFIEWRVYRRVPMDGEFDESIFGLLEDMITLAPDRLDPHRVPLLTYFLVKRPNDTLLLLSGYVRRSHRLKDPFGILDILLNYARAFIGFPWGKLYLDIILYVAKNYSEFRLRRMNRIRPILTEYLRSSRELGTVQSALLGTIMVYNDSYKLPWKALTRQLLEPTLKNSVLSLLKRAKNFPLAKQFIRRLAKMTDDRNALLVLLKISTQEDCHQVFIDVGDWMIQNCEACVRLALVLFLRLFIDQRYRQALADTPGFARLATSVIQLRDTSSVTPAVQLILDSVDIHSGIKESLSKTGFVASLIGIDDSLVALRIIQQLCTSGAVHGFAVAAPLLESILADHRNAELQTAAAHTISMMSSDHRCRNSLCSEPIMKYFASKRTQDARIFMNNMSQDA